MDRWNIVGNILIAEYHNYELFAFLSCCMELEFLRKEQSSHKLPQSNKEGQNSRLKQALHRPQW